MKRLPASSCLTRIQKKINFFSAKGECDGKRHRWCQTKNWFKFCWESSTTPKKASEQKKNIVYEMPAAHDIMFGRPPLIPPFWTRTTTRACAFFWKTRSMKFFKTNFRDQKPDGNRRKWLNSLKYEMNFLCDSFSSRNDIGFYVKNGVEKNAMPLKIENFQMKF